MIWNCGCSLEYWNGPASSTTHDIYFENNICYNAGRPGPRQRYGIHLDLSTNAANTYNFHIRNNVFISAEIACFTLESPWMGLNNLVLENNLYYHPSDKKVVCFDKAAYYGGDFDKYKNDTGKDGNSQMLKTPITLDFNSFNSTDDLRRAIQHLLSKSKQGGDGSSFCQK